MPWDRIHFLVSRILWLTKLFCRPFLSKLPISSRNQFSLLLSSLPHLTDEDGGERGASSLIEKYESSFISSLFGSFLEPVCARTACLVTSTSVNFHDYMLFLSPKFQLFSHSSINSLVIECPRVKRKEVLSTHRPVSATGRIILHTRLFILTRSSINYQCYFLSWNMSFWIEVTKLMI